MIQRIIPATILLTASSTIFATPVYHPSGSNLSYGHTNHNQMVVSYINNPAAAGTARKANNDVNSYQFGIITGGAGLEFGAVDNLFDQIDQQVQRIENSTLPSTPAQIEADIQTYIGDINAILQTVDNDGYAKGYASLHVPFTPLVIAASPSGGAWTFDANGSAISQAEVIHKDILFTTLNDPLDDVAVTPPALPGAPYSITVDADSTLLARAAAIEELSLGYGTRLFSSPLGDLYFGVRGKYYRVHLLQVGERLGNVINGSQSVFDNISADDLVEQTGYGLDTGVLLLMSNLQLGASLINVNEPTFSYNKIDLSTYKYPNSGAAQRLRELNDYTMQKQLRFEASLHSESKTFALNAALDANAVTDPFGDEYQWATANLSFNINSWFIPDLRVGYRANLAGSKLSYATAGISAFKAFTLDVAYGLEEVQIEGESAPRAAMVNVGLQVSF